MALGHSDSFTPGVEELPQMDPDDPFCDDSSNDDPSYGEPTSSQSNPDEWIETVDDAFPDKKVWICGYAGCGHRTDRLQKIQNHVRTHTKERPFVCSHRGCNKDFTRKDHLDRHVLSHGEGIPRPVACTWEGCSKRFQTRQHLDRHIKTHESKFYCTGYPPCKEFFRKQKTLNEHIAREHFNIYPYACDYVDKDTGERCTKTYLREGHLRAHYQSCHGEREAIYICEMCPAPGTELELGEGKDNIIEATPSLAFDTYNELKAHIREVHPPVCPQCGKRFRDQAGLDGHFNTVHIDPTKQPHFPCPEPGCGRVFKTNYNMKAHIRSVHEDHRPFICSASSFADSNKPDLKAWDGHDSCGMAFRARSTLEQHVRTQHINFKSRKQARQEAKGKRKSKAPPEPSTLRMLTGIGFDGGRHIPCLEAGCADAFFRDYDLRRHLHYAHKWEDHEITERILERDALQGGEFWVRHSDDFLIDSAEPSIPQTPDIGQEADDFQLGGGIKDSHIDPALQEQLHQMKLPCLVEEDEAQMDIEMGIGALQTWNMEHGLPGT
jgi:uncharacterized Zn-finger protein